MVAPVCESMLVYLDVHGHCWFVVVAFDVCAFACCFDLDGGARIPGFTRFSLPPFARRFGLAVALCGPAVLFPPVGYVLAAGAPWMLCSVCAPPVEVPGCPLGVPRMALP